MHLAPACSRPDQISRLIGVLDRSINMKRAMNAAERAAVFDMPPFHERDRQASYDATSRASVAQIRALYEWCVIRPELRRIC
jgi:hypothetical protein